MKKILYLSLILALMVFALGCTKKPMEIEPDVEIIEVIFSEEYENIISREESYNIHITTGIEQFKNYLYERSHNYQVIASEDAEALVAFVDFRLDLLEAQKNILSAEEKMELVVCEDENTFEEVINHLESAEASIGLALVSLENFRTNFPEFSAQTRITSETQETLHALVQETATALEEFTSSYEESCLQ